MSDLIHADAGTEIGPGVRPLLDALAAYLDAAVPDVAEVNARADFAAAVLLHAAARPAIVAELTAEVVNLTTAASAPPAPADATTALPVVAAEPEPEPEPDGQDENEPDQ